MGILYKIISNIFFGYGLAGFAFLILVMRIFYPYHRVAAVIVYLISWIPFVISYYQKRQLFEKGELMVRQWLIQFWPHMIFVVCLAIFIYSLYVIFPVSSPLSKLPSVELKAEIQSDSAALVYLDRDLEDLLKQMEAQEIFTRDGKTLIAESGEVRKLWEGVIGDMIEVDLIKNKYKGFPHINRFTRLAEHSDAFTLAYAAFMTQYKYGLKLSSLAKENSSLIVMLNEGGQVIPEESYDKLVFQLTLAKNLLRLNAGRLYLPFVRDNVADTKGLLILADSGIKVVDSSLLEYPALIVKNPLKILESKAFDLWFPVQKNIALQTSYMKFSTRDYIITPQVIQNYIGVLQPGDIFLERREWHATNVGIPGYWSHAAMYTGTLEEMEEYFSGVSELQGMSVAEYLGKNYPKAYETLGGMYEDGFAHRVIESKRPGVILTSLEHSAGGDSLGVFRAKNIDKAEQFKVLISAFQHLGKGYDYNFDFTTDETLVCSELIYKAYKSISKVNLELEDFNGRLILSPNSIAEKYDKEYGSDKAELDMVFLLKGNEKTKKVVEGTEEELRQSWTWPKWHIADDYLSGDK
ncbi:MAG: YiiX/YebB-like N1pC/P60 family cysteine hydrolase [Candidatus Peregrinibacteria bacterium]|nr:YiiX/YebB-like N1pC/P60 family cysteine hydrolase [Candidatus Peregrinibacteria bacterium]MDZ4244695.1 YiiX/YebB-like N1pC/P60 family cysteine hydrolase [Candidatus Gracilibacteria bacterium]